METRVTRELVISDEAAKAVEYSFNPSGNARAGEIKLLAAALITQIDMVMSEWDTENEWPSDQLAAGYDADKYLRRSVMFRRVAVAKTKIEEAAMWGVKAVHA